MVTGLALTAKGRWEHRRVLGLLRKAHCTDSHVLLPQD